MSDAVCPYCGGHQEINHEDGYGYEENIDYEQECINCDKTFKFTTNITYTYEVSCQEGDHEMEPFGDEYPHMYQCKKCDFYEKNESCKQDK